MRVEPSDSWDRSFNSSRKAAVPASGTKEPAPVAPIAKSISRPAPLKNSVERILPNGEGDVPQAALPRFKWQDNYTSCLISFALHFTLLLVLALWTIQEQPGSRGRVLHATQVSAFDGSEPTPLNSDDSPKVGLSEVQQDIKAVPTLVLNDDLPSLDNLPSGAQQVRIGVEALDSRFKDNLVGASLGGGLIGRSSDNRRRLALEGGGSGASEEAVEKGLRWLAAHQLVNGSWSFDHNQSVCNGACRHPGTETSSTGATALCLLSFLGAGYTHKEGEHQETVRKGLYYLTSRIIDNSYGGDLRDGSRNAQMYSHGMAALALCEAYAMTRDQELFEPSQKVINFIVHAQDPSGGGWRYQPRMPGDTTVSGWQIMALKSARQGYLLVPNDTFDKFVTFLNRVQFDGGARYGYTGPHKGRFEEDYSATSSIGLLCRMYTGWRRDYTPMHRGIRVLSQKGPSPDNMYYNYYSTLVMHHWGGDEWTRWNGKLRDYLVQTQAQAGHESGSWYFNGGYGGVGGRVYNTAMTVMTLEVYYRYLPLYGDEQVFAD